MKQIFIKASPTQSTAVSVKTPEPYNCSLSLNNSLFGSVQSSILLIHLLFCYCFKKLYLVFHIN